VRAEQDSIFPKYITSLFFWCKNVWTNTSWFVRVAHATQLNATTEHMILELELHKRKWCSPRLDATFCWKVLKCRKWVHPAGVHFRLPLLAMPPGSWSNATTRNTLISTKGNVYADPFVRTFLEPKAPQSTTWNALLDLCNVICTATQLMCTCTWIQMRKCLSPRLGT